ncbi:MAG: hypothetical protein ISS69_07495 [Phycisphaerae bacterium]|nr:hypothetical protein [Phycisphaerae bacterium]
MKQTLTALLAVLLFATIVVLAAEKATEKSNADILIARIKADYVKDIKDADAFYAKYTAPQMKARNKKILTAGSKAIRRLTSARKGVSELDGIKMEKEIEKIRKSLDKEVGKVVPAASVLKVCGISFKGHTYLAINSNANWKEADALCKKMGGHLAYIETAEELAFIAKAFRGVGLWVGATVAHKKRDWRWGNGKPIAKNFWMKGEPNNKGGDENYAALSAKVGQRLLIDAPLNYSSVVGFICEWE